MRLKVNCRALFALQGNTEQKNLSATALQFRTGFF